MVTADLNRASDRLADTIQSNPVAGVAAVASLGAGLVVSEVIVDWAVQNFSPRTGPWADAAAGAALGLLMVAGGNMVGGMAEGYLSVFALGAFAWAGWRAMEGLGVPSMLNDAISGSTTRRSIGSSVSRPTPSLQSRNGSTPRMVSAGGSGTTYR